MLTSMWGTEPVTRPKPCRIVALALALVLVAALAAAACSSGDSKSSPGSKNAGHGTAGASGRPNIVFVLTDDLDFTSFLDPARFPVFHDLMTGAGTSFSNFFV